MSATWEDAIDRKCKACGKEYEIRIAALKKLCQEKDLAQAETWALVLSHEAHIATIEKELESLHEEVSELKNKSTAEL